MRNYIYILTCLLFSSQALSVDIETRSLIKEKNIFVQEKNKVVTGGDFVEQRRLPRSLSNKGITNPEFYSNISNLIDSYLTKDKDSEEYLTLNWLVYALAYSGDEQYREKITYLSQSESKKLSKHSEKALVQLDKAKELNRALSREDLYTGTESWKSVRDANIILYSDEYKLKKKIIANAVVHSKYDALVFDSIYKRVLQDYKVESKERLTIDINAHMLKGLSHFPTLEYISLIEDASEHAGDQKLRKYAVEYLKSYKKRFDKVRLASRELLQKLESYKGEKFGQVENVFNITITGYRMRSAGSKGLMNALVPFGAQALGADILKTNVTLGVVGQENTSDINFIVTASQVKNGGEVRLARQYLIELNSKLQLLKTQ